MNIDHETGPDETCALQADSTTYKCTNTAPASTLKRSAVATMGNQLPYQQGPNNNPVTLSYMYAIVSERKRT